MNTLIFVSQTVNRCVNQTDFDYFNIMKLLITLWDNQNKFKSKNPWVIFMKYFSQNKLKNETQLDFIAN